jgi:AAA domain
MATIHTPLPQDAPGHHGEFIVGQILSKFSNPGLELWFDVNYIAGVTDLDLILLDNQVGYYLIEIKSMKIDAIQEFSSSSFVLESDVVKQHPVMQLRTGSIRLRDYLRTSKKMKERGDIPFIQCTVLWSEITRAEWKRRFSNLNSSNFDEMCIFKDDLDTYNKFVSALQRLWEKPILGVRVPLHARSEHGSTDAFRSLLKPDSHKLLISKPMMEEIRKPIAESKTISEKYTPGKSHRVSIQGAPGTGKTTILREVGLANLAAGGSVLYVCFNKVLAADQKREFQILRKKVEDYGFIDVFDVWELFKALGHVGGISSERDVLKNVESFLESEEGKGKLKYDVILVDESQDLTSLVFEVLEKIARPEASWFISYGRGQELHNLGSEREVSNEWLKNFNATAQVETRRRSFRNSPKAFLIAQSFWEKFPEEEAAKVWLTEKFKHQNQDDLQFELDLSVPQTKNDFRLEMIPKGPLEKAFIKNLLLQALDDARLAQRGGDLLVAVLKPSTLDRPDINEESSSSYLKVREVLAEVSEDFKIPFEDLVPNENRRNVPDIGAMRLVSLQSIRGLSASHVIIFDFCELEKWVSKANTFSKPPISNLGYIALSRSKASTIIVLQNKEESRIESFLLTTSSHLTKLIFKS